MATDEWDPWDVWIPLAVGTALVVLIMAGKSCGLVG